MARDYAKRTSSRPEKQPRTGAPGWLWMLGGLVIGLFVAGLVYLNEHRKSMPATPGEQVTAPVKEATPVAPKRRSEGRKLPKFDSYTILPEMEVVIPESELNIERRRLKEAKESKKGTFLLQAGSFRRFEQADSLKAQLALQGFEADIQKVDIKDGETWHRVRLGPYDNLEGVEHTQARLRRGGIHTIMVRLK